MIETITHKGLKLLWEKNNPSKLPADQLEKIKRILSILNTAKTLDPIRSIPGYRLHQLSGDLKGFWAIWTTGNYRVIFRFENGDVYDINYIDYH